MKKIKLLIILSLAIMTILTGCNVKKNEIDGTLEIKNQEEIQTSMEEKDLAVDIKSNSEILSSSGNTGTFLELSPILEGDVPENIQYHWIIDNPLNEGKDRAFEMFLIEEQGGGFGNYKQGRNRRVWNICSGMLCKFSWKYFTIVL